MDWLAVVGKNVRTRRLQLGLSQEELAHNASIDLSYLGGIERGKRNPSLMVIARIASSLTVEPAELLRR